MVDDGTEEEEDEASMPRRRKNDNLEYLEEGNDGNGGESKGRKR